MFVRAIQVTKDMDYDRAAKIPTNCKHSFYFLGYDFLLSTFSEETDEDVEVQLDGQLFEGMRGSVKISKDCVETDGYITKIILKFASHLTCCDELKDVHISCKWTSYGRR